MDLKHFAYFKVFDILSFSVFLLFEVLGIKHSVTECCTTEPHPSPDCTPLKASGIFI